MPKKASSLLAWSSAQQTYVLFLDAGAIQCSIEPESAVWFAWLDQVSSFAFSGQRGSATLRKEIIHGESYWYAYRRTGEKLTKKYIGKTAALTIARLEQCASMLEAMQVCREALQQNELLTPPDAEECVSQATFRPEPDSSRSLFYPGSHDPLFAAKLQVPRSRTQFVSRSHLLTRLQQVWTTNLTLISAPAGFGKTTLLTQWVTKSERTVAWLSLEPQDNDPTRFLSYLIAALQTLDPHVGTSVLKLLRSPEPTPSETVVALLTNDLMHSTVGDFALVLDDYHHITAERIQRAMISLLEHLPPQMHLVIATRADPSLPLSCLRTHGHLLEMRAADLRFSLEETRLFLQNVMGLALPIEAIHLIESRVEGWIAGLQLAALSLQGRADVSTFLSNFSGSHRFVLDYLSEEVLTRQPTWVQSFLLQTSILDRLSGPLCDAVTGQKGSEVALEKLEQANLFVVSLDDEQRWYRYHHLFAEVLRRQLYSLQPESLPELHRRASVWYEKHGQFVEAVNHALAAPDFEQAVCLIESCALSEILQGQLSTLLGWLDALPNALAQTRPFLCAQQAIALLITGQVDAALLRMQEAERSLHLDLPVEQIQMVRGWMALLHAGITYSKGDLRQSVMYAQEALRWFPENEEHWRAAVTSFANYSYLVSGDVRSAMEQQIVAAICGPGNLYTQLRQTANLARLQSMQGRLHQAALTYAQAEQRFPEHISLYAFAGTPAYSFGLGDVLREWNRLDEAEYHLTEGIELVRQTWLMDTHVILLGYVSLARLKLARRAFAEALSVLEEFSHLAQERDYNAVFIAQGVAIQMQIELAQGNLARAIRWADERTWPLEGEPLNYLCEREYLVMARVRIAQGRKEPKCALLHEVLGVLDRILKDAETKSRKSSVIEVLLLRALTFAVLDDRTQALLSLDRALQLAEPEGYIRLFIDEGKVMEALLHQAQAHGSAVDYVGALLAAYCTQRETVGLPGMSPSGGLIEPLTEREREVLRLLVAGLSNAAIAEKLVITVGTVKRHINSIYGKLGVNSRPQAIRCAHMLGLL